MEEQIHMMNSDENESQMHDLESKRDCVYEALEYARGQIKNVMRIFLKGISLTSLNSLMKK